MLASNPPRNNRSETHRHDEGAAPRRPSSIMTIDFLCLRKRTVPIGNHLPRLEFQLQQKSRNNLGPYLLGLPTPNPGGP
jgi:hypothetical protein